MPVLAQDMVEKIRFNSSEKFGKPVPRVAGAKLSLHFGLVYFWQPEFEAVKENLLVVGWLGKTPAANVDATTGRENHVHHSQFAQLIQNTTWLASKTGSLAHLA